MAADQYTFDHMMRQVVEAADVSRAQMMARAIKAYNDHAQRPLKIDPQTRIDDNVCINYARTIVEKGVSFLFGEQLKIEIAARTNKAPSADAQSADDETFEDALEDLWPALERGEDLIDFATNGGQTGHVWAQVVVEGGVPRVVVLDPLNMTAEYDERDLRRVLSFTNQWNSFDAHGRACVRKQVTRRNGETWTITEYISLSNATTWTQAGPVVEWRYKFAPIIHTKNLPHACVFYGAADLTLNVLQLNFYINRVDSLINKILRIHAHPKTVAYGLQEQDLRIGVDGVLFVDEYEAELKNLEMQSDLGAAQTFRDKLRAALAEVSHVPEVTTGKIENLGTLSGRAIQMLYGPLIDQTKKKRITYGRFVTEIIVALLTITGKVIKARDVSLHWGSMLPADEKEAAETAVLKRQVGFSDDTLVQELGGDPDKEREKKATQTDTLGETLGKAFDAGAGAGGWYGSGASSGAGATA